MFFFNDTATTEIYTLSLHDALPIVSYRNATTRRVVPAYELNATSKNATSSVQNDKSDSRFWQWENVLSYNKAFGLHGLGALVGTSMSAYHHDWLGGSDFNLLSTALSKGYIDTATDRKSTR